MPRPLARLFLLPPIRPASICTRRGAVGSGARWGPQSVSGAAISGSNWSASYFGDGPFRHKLAAPELGDSYQLNFLSCCLSLRKRFGVPQGLVDFPAHPQMMQQHRQISCHRHYRPLLRVLASPSSDLQPPALQVRIRGTPVQHAMRSLYQQRPQVPIAFLGDPQLRLALTRFAALGPQSHVTTVCLT